jgi:hypothetical protein
MIYEYAVSPGLFCSDAHMAFLQAAFGIDQGRLISDFPKRGWERLAREVIERSAPDEYEKRAWKEALIGLYRRAVFERRGSTYDDARSWLENALTEHTTIGRPPFRGIVTNPGPQVHSDVITVGAAISAHARWACDSSCYVNRTAAALVTAMAPVLDLASLVVLIDRHFRADDGVFLNPLRAVAEYLASGSPRNRVAQIKYVCSPAAIELTRAAFEARCRASIPQIIPRGMEVKFTIVPPVLLHDRFLLTNRAALQFGHGLDEATGLHEGAGQVLVTRLSAAPFAQRMDQWRRWTEVSNPMPSFTVASTN